MRYYRHQGVVEKDKKGHKKLWVGFFASFAVIAYGGFLFVAAALSGWPLEPHNTTAEVVKTTKPGAHGDTVYLPTINTRASVGKHVTQKGVIGQTVMLTGEHLAFGLTPTSTREKSPFFNIDRLRQGDQIFLDSKGVRYAYEIGQSEGKTKSKNLLILSDGDNKRLAHAVGKIAWKDGEPTLESL